MLTPIIFQSCEICQEQFEQYWDEEEEEWHLKNAIRVDEKVIWSYLHVMLTYSKNPKNNSKKKKRGEGKCFFFPEGFLW